MKGILLYIFILLSVHASAQIDPGLLRRVPRDSSGVLMNMDAAYNRPFLQVGKLPVALEDMQRRTINI